MILRVVLAASALFGVALGTMFAGRKKHDRDIARIRDAVALEGGDARYSRELVAHLPAVARRFFERSIAEGTRVPGSVHLTMEGKIGLRPGAEKSSFAAEQVLSRKGLVWEASVGAGPMRIAGDDSYLERQGAMAWYLSGVVPVVKASGIDVSRSAAGRVALELAVFLPTALLPSEGARWDEIDEGTARVTLDVDGEEFQPMIQVDAEGRLRAIEMPRWDGDRGDGTPGLVLWRAELEGHWSFDGVTIPALVKVTKRFGTADADPFFEAKILNAEFR